MSASVNMLDIAEFYRSEGLRVIPLKPRSKEPLVRWKKYQNQEPTEDELRRWFEDKTPEDVGIGIIVGVNDVVVLDIEDTRCYELFFDESIEELAKKTWICKTGKGYHIYFKYNGDAKNIKAERVAEIRAKNVICATAPSYHPNGNRYEYISDIKKVQIASIDVAAYTELYGKIELIRKHFDWLTRIYPYWIEGCRHDLALYLAGALRKMELTIDECKTLTKLICILSNDEEIKDRIRAVEDTYAKPESDIAGLSRVEEVLSLVAGDEKAREIIERINRAFGKRSVKRSEKKKEVSDDEIIDYYLSHKKVIKVHPSIDVLDDKLIMGVYLEGADGTLFITENELITVPKYGKELNKGSAPVKNCC